MNGCLSCRYMLHRCKMAPGAVVMFNRHQQLDPLFNVQNLTVFWGQHWHCTKCHGMPLPQHSIGSEVQASSRGRHHKAVMVQQSMPLGDCSAGCGMGGHT